MSAQRSQKLASPPNLSGASQMQRLQRPLATVFDPSIYWQGLGKHLVDNAPSVGIVRRVKNPVDAREKNIQQRVKSLSLASASVEGGI